MTCTCTYTHTHSSHACTQTHTLLSVYRCCLQLRAEYAKSVREEGVISKLLHSVFCLMPTNPIMQLKDSLNLTPGGRLGGSKNLFNEEPPLLVTGIFVIIIVYAIQSNI